MSLKMGVQARSDQPPPDPGAQDVRWHRHSADETLDLLATARTGLSAEEVTRRRAQYGPNLLEEKPHRPPLAILAAQFTDLMILVLVGAAVISGAIGELADTIVIAVIIVLNAVIGFVQEFRAERALAALKAMAAPTATVLRDGRAHTVAAADLVPGDAVMLEAGRIVPADLRLIEAASLRTDESALTGESEPIEKMADAIATLHLPVADRRNIAHKGTFVTYGRALGLVIATGMRTELGRIATMLKEGRTLETPLQRRLRSFGRRLALAVLIICTVIFVTGLLRGEPVLPMFLTALSLAVAAIPEALPAVVSISLALGARKMLARRALIRRLPAVETLGSVTFICADKTGTLTTNEMRAEQYYCDGACATQVGTNPAWQALLDAMALSHDATTDTNGEAIGDPTEVALLRAAASAGFERPAREARLPRVSEIPFDSGRKRMTTLHSQADGTFLSMTKGAPDVLLSLSVRELRGTGMVPIDRLAIGRIADAMAADGLRVLAVAVRHWQSLPCEITPATVERDLELVGLIGLIDPPRPEAAEAIATCRAAGIVPVMITGDHPLTAHAIARRVGLLEEDSDVVSGTELAALSSQELERRVRDIRVYARVAPEEKLKIVTALQECGEIVAMTGDGVNDAPALQRADIGVAMGIAGTDVAKEASDMVLLDDNFATVVSAVSEGRRIYDNLRRFVRYVLTTNSGEIWTIFLAPFIGLPIPLLPIQILWINLVTDGLPGLALAAEPPERDLMQRPPRPPTESILARGLGAHALLVGSLMAALALSVQAWYVQAGSPAWQTAVFTTLCFAQLAHVLAIRSEHTSLFTQKLGSNRPLLAAVIFTFFLQLAVVYVPTLNALFRTTPLSVAELAVCLTAALVVFGAVELEKAWRRRPRTAAVTPHAASRLG